MGRQRFASAHRPSGPLRRFAADDVGHRCAAACGRGTRIRFSNGIRTSTPRSWRAVPGPLPATRVTALVQAAVFDAVNGIARRYPSVHVARKGHGGASQEAAAIQAAYAMLVRVYPLQAATLLTKRNASLGALGLSRGEERRGAVERGVAWGQEVADAIWAWRSTDGFAPNPPPPFRGAAVNGVWRPTPPANLDGAGPNFATMTPWVLQRPSQFRPGPPPALNSARTPLISTR